MLLSGEKKNKNKNISVALMAVGCRWGDTVQDVQAAPLAVPLEVALPWESGTGRVCVSPQIWDVAVGP